jgi:hypothetical protein
MRSRLPRKEAPMTDYPSGVRPERGLPLRWPILDGRPLATQAKSGLPGVALQAHQVPRPRVPAAIPTRRGTRGATVSGSIGCVLHCTAAQADHRVADREGHRFSSAHKGVLRSQVPDLRDAAERPRRTLPRGHARPPARSVAQRARQCGQHPVPLPQTPRPLRPRRTPGDRCSGRHRASNCMAYTAMNGDDVRTLRAGNHAEPLQNSSTAGQCR